MYPCCSDVGFMLIALRRRVNASWKKNFIVAQVFSWTVSQLAKSFTGKMFAFLRTRTALMINCMYV